MSSKEYVRRPRNHACTQCKQMKVRCEGEKDASLVDPCRRCKARGLECFVDSSFKRTPARQRAKAIEAELSRLRQEVDQQHMQLHGESTSNRPLTPYSHPSPSLGDSAYVPVDPTLEASLVNAVPSSEKYLVMLGTVGFTQREVEDTFEIFKQRFAWQLSIFDIETPLNVLYTCSPLLFWTIVVITRQRFATDDIRQPELSRLYSVLLKSTMLEPPLSLHTIQAIVLLCFWPLPVESQLRDPSWLYMDVAISAARYLDLNSAACRPFYHGGQLSQKDMEFSSRTWLAIFVVSSSLATFFGIKANQKSAFNLKMIEFAINQPSTPRRLAAQASLTLIVADYYSAIDAEMAASSQEALAESCCLRLDQVSFEFAKAWDRQLDLSVAACKLHMCATILVRSIRSETRMGWGRLVMLEANTAACRVLDIFSGIVRKLLINGCIAPSTPQAKALPKNGFRHALNAVFFLLNFTCFNRDCPEDERQRALQAMNKTVQALKDWSVRPEDEPARSCAALQAKLDHSELWQTQQLQINDRDSASILYSSVRFACNRRNKHPDLLELIDPTRGLKKKDGTVDQTAYCPTYGNQCDQDFVWDEAMLEFFDLGVFDQSDMRDGITSLYGVESP